MRPRLLTETFTCGMCKIEKPYHEFKKNRARFSGYANYCLQCHREHTAKKRAKNIQPKPVNTKDAMNNLFSLWNSCKGNHG
jgi:hypothetical protein